jgi:hypothetical protein
MCCKGPRFAGPFVIGKLGAPIAAAIKEQPMRPRLLLVPTVTEMEWPIKPQSESWADVASYDAPGVGDEPPPEALASSRSRSAGSKNWIDANGRGS